MPSGLVNLLWLLIPLVATSVTLWVMRRNNRMSPNADIDAGVSEMHRFRRAMAATNPPDAPTPTNDPQQ
jgi:hypothetical protein